ncbi:MAG: flagellar basal body P-ring protein FlgI [Phycisphaerales bacterium]|nr:flagellar basal body P-ring protein FlgI [Phycisphaerales bacterium]
MKQKHSVSAMTKVIAAVAIVGALMAPGCDSPMKRARTISPVVRDVPAVLRGTIGSEAEIIGTRPIVVSGYGLVVGVNGTGGGIVNERIAATMERMMALNKISKATDFPPQYSGLQGKTPSQLLRDPDVAVVLVQAAIAPGSPDGSTFDVYVRAINATSLEGGTLWTTDMAIGDATPLGGFKTRNIAQAKGPIFLNPFAEPGKEDNGVSQTVGRILDGGVVTQPLQLIIQMDNVSFDRARAITGAINTRFPEEPGDDGPAARGKTGGNIGTGEGGRIALSIPGSWRNHPIEFLNLVRSLQIDQTYPEEHARRYIEALKSEPRMAGDLAWCLEAVGPKALPFIRPMYDYPEIVPRLAALQAGARLNDPRAGEALRELAISGTGAVRTQAIDLLALIDGGPTVDVALRELCRAEELTVRASAYEALATRAAGAQLNRMMRAQRDTLSTDPRAIPRPLTHLEELAKMQFPGRTVQGISREVVEGKFLLDVVPYGEPMIYITQQGRPRVVVFGARPALDTEILVSTWSDRLMIDGDESTGKVRVYYRDYRDERVTTSQLKPDLVQFIRFLAHEPTPSDPEPGLGMRYSEVVGALYAIHQAKGTDAAFTTERDKLLAEILDAEAGTLLSDRPEGEEDRLRLEEFKKPQKARNLPSPVDRRPQKPELVPIAPPPPTVDANKPQN